MNAGEQRESGVRGSAVAAWIAVAATLVPAALYAYLGHFSRLMIDDYGIFATALWLGFRDYFAYWRNTWHGSYSFYVFHDLLAPLDPARMPPVFPALIIALWLLGLTWLLSIMLRHLEIRRARLPIAIALAALTAHASFMSFHTWESIYWYAAATSHTLPVGVLLLFLAFALDTAKRLRSTAPAAVAALAGALICFVNGGFSPLYAGIQLVGLPLLIGLLVKRASNPGRHTQIAVLAAGFCGSIVSAVGQLTAPGVANRMETATNTLLSVKVIRDLPALALETLRSSIEYFGHQGSILGFMLLLAAGLVAALLIYRPEPVGRAAQSPTLSAPPLLIGLAIQLAFMPTLWTDLGALAFNGGAALYLAVGIAALNIVFLLAYPIALGRRRLIASVLERRIEYLAPTSAALMLGVFALLMMTQPTGLHYRIALYLFANAFALLVILAQILDSVAADRRSRQLRLVAFSSLALAAIAMALSLAIGHFGLGYIFVRSLSFAALTQVLPGLAWGAYIGFLIQRCRLLRGGGAQVSARYILPGFIIIVGIIIADISAQARLIPDFATFAREWDARHEHIVRMRDRGVRDIEIPPFSFDMSGYISASGEAFGESHPYYYRVDSITLVD